MTVKQLIRKLSRIDNQDIEVRFVDTQQSEEALYKIKFSYRKQEYESNGTLTCDAYYLEGTLL